MAPSSRAPSSSSTSSPDPPLIYGVASTDQLRPAPLIFSDGGVLTGPVQCAASEAGLSGWGDSMLAEPPLLAQAAAWPDEVGGGGAPDAAVVARRRRQEEEEDSGVRLVHLLMSCAGAIQLGDTELAAALVDDIRGALPRAAGAIGKVASYFADALFRRLWAAEPPRLSPVEADELYHNFYEACPYLKFAHFTANQAILEAFAGCDRVHIVDFSLMQGLQWPALIQALALRPGGPPFLRITGIGPPSLSGRDELREVGLRLAEVARSARLRFAFRGVAASRLDEVRPWMLQIGAGEAVAINSVLQLHRLVGDPGAGEAPADTVLAWVAGLRPKVVAVVEQEADHNKPAFLERFTEAMFYYSTVFDSLAAAAGPSSVMAELYLQQEICDIVCREGGDRAERHEPLSRWRARLGRAGLAAVPLGSNAFRQVRTLLSLFSGEGYCVEEDDGCLTLGWHGRPLLAASAWRPGAAPAAAEGVNQ